MINYKFDIEYSVPGMVRMHPNDLFAYCYQNDEIFHLPNLSLEK